MIMGILENEPILFKAANIPPDLLVKMNFEYEMNVLNLAIDQ